MTLFRRIGQMLPTLSQIEGAEERAERLMTKNLSQPDDGIFELLVAATYKRRGWENVSFVPEAPGLGKRNDLFVDRGRSHWAVECKRAGRSGYARKERLAGERMAERAHARSRQSDGTSDYWRIPLDLANDFCGLKLTGIHVAPSGRRDEITSALNGTRFSKVPVSGP